MRKTRPSGDVSNRYSAPLASDHPAHKRRQFRTLCSAGQAPAEALEPRLFLARDLYVDIASPGPTYDGSSWASAYPDLQQALSAATAGDRLLIADGTYKPTSTTNRSIAFGTKQGVSLLGGYAGYGAANPDVRDLVLYRTMLSGDIGTVGADEDNSYHVIFVSTGGVLDGLTIADGNGDRGGGMYTLNGASPTLIDCTFAGNWASSGGGAMYIEFAASPELTNCTFIGNSDSKQFLGSRGGGGAIYNYGGNPRLTNCTFVANAAASYGGAFLNYGGDPRLTNCIIWACGTTPFYREYGSPTVSYSDIQGGYGGSGNISADPLFARSPWAGPDGRFGTPDDDYGDLRLRSGSPALSMGAYAGAITAPAAKMIYVDAAAVGANTGSSWTDAFTSLLSALLAAADGDTIRVADGTYKPTTTTNRNHTFALRNNVALHGGYAGYGAANPDAQDVRLYPTVLCGDIGIAGDSKDNSYHVVAGIGLLFSAVLDGFTITAGYADRYGYHVDGDGGGMLSLSSSPTLNNCIFSSNGAYEGGGMAMLGTSAPTVSNCTFIGNVATGGGAVYTYASAPSLRNSGFIRNSARDGGGGGVLSRGLPNASPSAPTLVNVGFFGNSANIGGAINFAEPWAPVVSDGLFVGNSAQTGGAVANHSYNGVFTNCTFSGNTASTAGAMYSFTPSIWAPTLVNCIVWGNGAAPLYPGGYDLVISRSDIEGSTIVGSLNADPQFVRAPSAGLDGTWGTEDDDYGNLRLRYTSPCIDAGSNGSGNLVGVTKDLDGNPRFVEVPTVPNTGYGSIPLVDLGVYEMPAAPDTTAPTITSVSINDGAAQRSMVKRVAVIFSKPMSLAPGALTVKLSTGQVVPNTTLTLTNPSADQQTYTLTFSGTGAPGGSLPDGIYDLLISAASAQDLAGNTLVADYSKRFHRLFGDADGNKVVNALDYAKLKATYGRSSADPLFNPAFDYEGNNVINALDLAQFRKRYGLGFSY